MQPPGQGQGGVLIRSPDGTLWFLREGDKEWEQFDELKSLIDARVPAEGDWSIGNYIPSDLAEQLQQRHEQVYPDKPPINWAGVFFVFVPPLGQRRT
jgi:hypothetical protein